MSSGFCPLVDKSWLLNEFFFKYFTTVPLVYPKQFSLVLMLACLLLYLAELDLIVSASGAFCSTSQAQDSLQDQCNIIFYFHFKQSRLKIT